MTRYPNVSFMSRLYSHMNYSRIEAEQYSSAPPSQFAQCVSNLSNDTSMSYSEDREGFYAMAELFQQRTETKELKEICSTKLNRVYHLAFGKFGDDVSLLHYLII